MLPCERDTVATDKEKVKVNKSINQNRRKVSHVCKSFIKQSRMCSFFTFECFEVKTKQRDTKKDSKIKQHKGTTYFTYFKFLYI